VNITQEIARKVVATSIGDLPAEVVGYSATLAMSALGAMAAGYRCAGGREVVGYVQRAGGTGEATVLGHGFKTTMEMAGLANGTFAHATEYEDDSFPEAVSSYTLFPAILAVAEHAKASGARVVESFVAGYEVQARIGLACRQARRNGYMVLSLAGSIGCAASAAKLLGLDAHQTAMALSLAASQGSGIGYQTGTMAHIVEMGFSARNGIAAALMAAQGMTGQPDVLEAPRGLMNMITGDQVENPAGIVDDWGKPYRLMEIGIKSYPCCYHLQRIIQTTVELRHEEKLAAADIDEVSVEVNAFFPTVVQHMEPHDEIEAQFSLPHVVAIAMLEDQVVPAGFAQARIDDEAFKAFRRKVKQVVREDWGWTPTGWTPRITYKLKDGRVIVREPKQARGQPPALLTFDECVPKYLGCVQGIYPEKQVTRSIELLRGLAKLDSVAELMQCVAVPGARQDA